MIKKMSHEKLEKTGRAIGITCCIFSAISLIIVCVLLNKYIFEYQRTKSYITASQDENSTFSGPSWTEYYFQNLRIFADYINSLLIIGLFCLLQLITSILLIVGIKKKKRNFILSWIIVTSLIITYCIVAFVISLGFQVLIVLPIGLLIYLLYLVSIILKQIDKPVKDMEDIRGVFIVGDTNKPNTEAPPPAYETI